MLNKWVIFFTKGFIKNGLFENISLISLKESWPFGIIDNPEDNADEFENNPAYKLYGFQFEETKYRADSYRSIFKEIIKLLYNIDNSVLDDLANSNYTYERGKTIRFSRTKENEHQEEILPSLFVYTNYSRSTIFDWIRDLFNRYQLDISLFCLLFIEKE